MSHVTLSPGTDPSAGVLSAIETLVFPKVVRKPSSTVTLSPTTPETQADALSRTIALPMSGTRAVAKNAGATAALSQVSVTTDDPDDPLKALLPARKKDLAEILKKAPPEVKKLVEECGTPPLANTNDHIARASKTTLTKKEAEDAIKQYGDSKAYTTTLVKGDAKLGKIHVLKQVHNSNTTVDEVGEGPIEKLAVGAYHAHMLQYLTDNTKGTVYIFDEGRAVPYGDKEQKLVREQLSKKFDPKKAFPQTPGHKFELSIVGVGKMFHHYNSERVELLAAEPKEPFVAVRKYGLEQVDKGDLHLGMYLLNEVRENLSLKECAKFLKANPGATVYLIYGAGHTWDENDLKGAKEILGGMPELVETGWPGLVDRLPSRTTALLKAIGPEQKLELIKKAPSLEPMAFGVLESEDAQLLAVEKILYGNPKQVELFGKGYLLKLAKTDKVKEAINSRFPGEEIDLAKPDPKSIKLVYGY